MPSLYAESRSVSFPVSVRVEPRLALEAQDDSTHREGDVEDAAPQPIDSPDGEMASTPLDVQIRTNRGFPFQLTQTLRQPATESEALTLDSHHLPPADPESAATEVLYTVTAL